MGPVFGPELAAARAAELVAQGGGRRRRRRRSRRPVPSRWRLSLRSRLVEAGRRVRGQEVAVR